MPGLFVTGRKEDGSFVFFHAFFSSCYDGFGTDDYLSFLRYTSSSKSFSDFTTISVVATSPVVLDMV